MAVVQELFLDKQLSFINVGRGHTTLETHGGMTLKSKTITSYSFQNKQFLYLHLLESPIFYLSALAAALHCTSMLAQNPGTQVCTNNSTTFEQYLNDEEGPFCQFSLHFRETRRSVLEETRSSKSRADFRQPRYKKSIFWSDEMKIPLFIGEYHSVHVGAKAGEWGDQTHPPRSKQHVCLKGNRSYFKFHQNDLLKLDVS